MKNTLIVTSAVEKWWEWSIFCFGYFRGNLGKV